VTATLFLLAATGALLALLTVLFLFVARRGRAWAAVLLGITGVFTLAAITLQQAVVEGGPEVDRYALLAQAALVVAGLVTLGVRSSRSWLRAARP
jgi:hypothetical protein